jgi:uncharacterized protein
MADDTIRATIDFIAGDERFEGNVGVVLAGGEPLLHLDAVEMLVSGLREALPEGRHLQVTLPTNATLMDDARAEVVLNLGCRPRFSIDGPARIHDRQRVFPDGSGSHEAAMRGLETWRRLLNETGKDLPIAAQAAVLNRGELADIVRFFEAAGVHEYSAIPVRRSAWCPRPRNRPDKWYARELAEEARCYVARHRPAMLFEEPPGLQNLRKLLLSHLFATDVANHCGIGRSVFGIAVDGGLWPCDGFIGLDDSLRLGDVRSGFDAKRLQHLESLQAEYLKKCGRCKIESQCGEACLAQALVDGILEDDEPTTWCAELRWMAREIEALTAVWGQDER